ncbi:unnamed protein product [Ixodes pacificus]
MCQISASHYRSLCLQRQACFIVQYAIFVCFPQTRRRCSIDVFALTRERLHFASEQAFFSFLVFYFPRYEVVHDAYSCLLLLPVWSYKLLIITRNTCSTSCGLCDCSPRS